MKKALLAWPRLSTVLLIQLTYRLWFWGGLLALLLVVLPLQGLLEAILKKQLPEYASGVALLFLGLLIDKILDLFFHNGIFWRACELLLAKTINAQSLNPKQPTFNDLRPQRLRGDVDAWRTSMGLFAQALPASSSGSGGASDAARRLAPRTFAGGLLCGGVVLAPWAWPKLTAQLDMTSIQLSVAAFALWVILSVLLGRLASHAVAPWIRTRCL